MEDAEQILMMRAKIFDLKLTRLIEECQMELHTKTFKGFGSKVITYEITVAAKE